jgi:hypothetical protein
LWAYLHYLALSGDIVQLREICHLLYFDDIKQCTINAVSYQSEFEFWTKKRFLSFCIILRFNPKPRLGLGDFKFWDLGQPKLDIFSDYKNA